MLAPFRYDNLKQTLLELNMEFLLAHTLLICNIQRWNALCAYHGTLLIYINMEYFTKQRIRRTRQAEKVFSNEALEHANPPLVRPA